MTRDDVLAMVIRNVKEVVPTFQGTETDLNKSYRDLGVKSLDLVEIMTGIIRDMQMKIPIAEFAKISTINGLVDYLFKVKSELQA
ncbi:MAG TPA: phosphopantetheine-binding protein [Syntrophobacteraceae bacterium]|nr:phosphopantetheine-binding protein [Syntrophobacteraceae bacterium]